VTKVAGELGAGQPTLAGLYSDEVRAAIRGVFESVAEHGAVVPVLWRLEIANGLTVAARRGRIDTEVSPRRPQRSCNAGNRDGPANRFERLGETLHLADRCGLTVYGAAYLELAIRRRFPLATLDDQLRAGAAACGVQLLGKD
jgi:predicted nucleic acid-binding protein